MTLGRRSRCRRRSSPWCWYCIDRMLSRRATLPSIADHLSKYQWAMSCRSYTPRTYNDSLSRLCSSCEIKCPRVRRRISNPPSRQFYQTSLPSLLIEALIWNPGSPRSCKTASCNFVFSVFILRFLIVWTDHARPIPKLVGWRATSKTAVDSPLFWSRPCQDRSCCTH